MERQLLYLLDFDTRITEQDLYQHFEPFLAPIRLQIELDIEEEQRRLQNIYTFGPTSYAPQYYQHPVHAIQKQEALPASAVGVYSSPQSFVDEQLGSPVRYPATNSIHLPPLVHKRRSSPTNLRTGRRPISPPSIRDLPSLSRSSTSNTLPSLSESLPSSRSSSIAPSLRSETPSSISSGTDDQIAIVDESSNFAYHKAAIRPEMKTHQLSFHGEQQPAKKAKTSMGSSGVMGGMMARIFNTATGRGQIAPLHSYNYQQQLVA